MEIKQYFEPLIKWWWLILLACVLAGISSFLLVRQQPPTFQARTTLVIGSAVYEPNPSSGALGIASQLTTYYANIAQRELVRNETMNALNIQWLPEYSVAVVPNSQLIEIVVTDTDPQRAQVVANELANQLIQQTPSNTELVESQRQAFVNGQLLLLEEQITTTLDEIAQKEEQLGELNSARDISNAQQEIAALQQKLTTLQTNYAQLLGSSTGKALNSLTVVEPAVLPNRPVGPNKFMTILMSIAIAFAISAAAAYLIEYLDDTFKTPEEITKTLGIPVIGHIALSDIVEDGELPVKEHPNSLISETFRSIGINIDFMEMENHHKMILVTSISPQEGKSFISSNLAWSLASSGKKVILADTDLRRPNIHKLFELGNTKGLSDIIRGQASTSDAIQRIDDLPMGVITTGSSVPNISGILGSKKMDTLLDELRAKADIILLDGAPIPVTDSKLMATKADIVFLVVKYGQTRRSVARDLLKQLSQVNTTIAGVIFNGIPEKRSYYKAYHYYYGSDDDKAAKNKIKIPVLNVSLRNPFRLKRS